MFTINSNDYTKYIQDGTYNINKVDIGDSWTDGNYKQHRNHVLKVQGTFDMAFITDDEYDDFLSDIEAAKNNDGYVVCNIFVVNKNISENIECYLNVTTKNYRPVNAYNVVNMITVSIEEG